MLMKSEPDAYSWDDLVRDGEGATKFVKVTVDGAASPASARKLAKSIADSPLVKTAIAGEAPKLRTWVKDVKDAMGNLKMDPAFADRNVNEGFSGGEKKRHEILQMELLKPKMAILDETDSGLDVDALRIVSEGVNRAKAETNCGVLLITHYTRILRYIKPDHVHVFVNGRVAEEGGPELADRLEAEGYDRYVNAAVGSEVKA